MESWKVQTASAMFVFHMTLKLSCWQIIILLCGKPSTTSVQTTGLDWTCVVGWFPSFFKCIISFHTYTCLRLQQTFVCETFRFAKRNILVRRISGKQILRKILSHIDWGRGNNSESSGHNEACLWWKHFHLISIQNNARDRNMSRWRFPPLTQTKR